MPHAPRRAPAAILLAPLAAAALALAGCTAAAPMPTPTPTPSPTYQTDGVLRIGTLFPTSGVLDFLGKGQVAAVNAAVRQINAEGGVLGADVEVVHRDSGDSKQKIDASFDELVAKGVDVVIGPTGSALALHVLPRAIEAGIPLVSPSATSPQLASLDPDGWIFRTVPSYEHQGAVLGSLLPARDQEAVVLLHADGAIGTALEEPLEESLAASGGELVASIRLSGDADAAAIAARAAASAPDAVVLATNDNGALTRALVQELAKAQLGGAKLWLTSQNLADYSQALPKGALTGVNGILEGAPADDAFRARVKQEDPSVGEFRYTPEAFDAAVLVALAAITAGTDAGAGIRAHLAEASVGGIKCTGFGECASVLATEPDADYDGISGPLNLDEHGDPDAGSFGLYVYTDGNVVERKGTEIG